MTWRKRLPTTDWCIHADSMQSPGSVALAALPFSSSDSSCIGSSLRVQTGSSSSTAYKGECQWKGLQKEDYLNPTCSAFQGVTMLFVNEIFFNNTEFRLTYQAQLSLVLTVGLVHWQWLEKNYTMIMPVNFLYWRFKLLTINMQLKKQLIPGTSTTLVGGFEDMVLICRI